MVEPGFLRLKSISILTVAAQGHKKHGSNIWKPAQVLGHLKAIHPGQADVQENDIGLKGLGGC